MLVLRLLLMVLTIICLMDGHAEVSSSTTGMRNGRDSPAVKPNETEYQILDRKKKPKKPKKPKKTGKKKGKKPKPKPKPKPTKPVTTTPLMTTSTLKTTTILTTTTTTETTTPTSTPTTTATTTEITTSTATITTTTATVTTTEASTPTASTITTKTTTTTATTSSPPTTAATTADSGAGGECEATNGKSCIFPFKDGNEEYNECKNEGGKYFWCATSVYDSGKYKHWSYCPEDRSCPLEGDGECRATNNKPCVFPFKDGNKEYNECADHSGQYFWCATGTNSAGKYTAWSKCPKDGSCPLPQKTTTPAMTPAATAATTTLLTTGTSTAPDEIENKVISSLKDLVKEESKDGTLEMLEAMHKITETIIEDLKEQSEDNDPKNIESNHTFQGGNPQSQELSLQYKQGVKSGKTREIKQNFEFVQNTVSWCGSISPVSDASGCCSECQSICSDAAFFDYSHYFGKCYCYKKLSTTEAMIRENNRYSAGDCGSIDTCCETINIFSSGDTAKHQGERLGTYKKDGEYNNKPFYKQKDGSKVLFFSKFDDFDWVVGSSVNSGGGLRSKPGKASDCPNDGKEWEYYVPGTTNTWILDSTVAIDCEGTLCKSKSAGRIYNGDGKPNGGCPSSYTYVPAKMYKNIRITARKEFVLSSSIDSCASFCKETPLCFGFSWERCPIYNEVVCRLLRDDIKSGPPLLESNKDFCMRERKISCSSSRAWKCPPRSSWVDHANNLPAVYQLIPPGDTDEENCASACEEHPNCVGTLFNTCALNPLMGSCYLLTEDHYESTDTDLNKIYNFCISDYICMDDSECTNHDESHCKTPLGLIMGICNPCSNHNHCKHITNTDVCVDGLCSCNDATLCGLRQRCLRRLDGFGRKCTTVNNVNTGRYKKAYRKYELSTDNYSWKSIWSQIRRTATFSHVNVNTYITHKKIDDYEFSMAKDPSTNPYAADTLHNYFTGTVGTELDYLGPFVSDNTITMGPEYANLGFDRGHLLASSIIRKLFNTDSADNIKHAVQAMMNVFPQDNECNQGHGGTAPMWASVEKAVMKAADACLDTKFGIYNTHQTKRFFVTHALAPAISGKSDYSTINLHKFYSFPFEVREKTVNLGHSEAIFTNYCCMDMSSMKIISSRSVITTNPFDRCSVPGHHCTAEDSKTSRSPYDIYLKFFTGDYTNRYRDLNQKNPSDTPFTKYHDSANNNFCIVNLEL